MVKLGLVWLVSLITVCETTVGAHAAAINGCDRRNCQKTVYDVHEAVCCENQIYPGAGLSCCGGTAFNPAAATCCKEEHGHTVTAHVTEGLSEMVSECCGLSAYNPLNEICCDSTVVTKSAADAQCCGSEACDEHKQLCCGPMGNRTVLMRESSHHQCCGHEQFNTKTHCCCWTDRSVDIHHIHAKCCKEETALQLSAYNNFPELRCQSTVVANPPPNAQCCGEEAYDEHKQLCCGPMGNRTVMGRESSHHQCCGHEQFNTKTHCCCWTNGSVDIHHIHNKCCKEESEAFDDVKQLLCGPIGQNRTILTRTSIDHECCGYEQFNTKTECCCWTNGSFQIQPISASCCVEESVVQPPKPGTQPTCTEPETSICGSSCYNPKEFRCCERKQSNQCCISGQCDAAPAVYNPRTAVCCDGRVSERKGQPNQLHASPGHCCGTEVYRPHDEICCDGHRHPKEKNEHCCGARTYNIKNPQMKCCAGTLYNLALLGHDAQCCGSILQKTQDVCCSHEEKTVLWSAKTGFRCCAHLYYNTSLWACYKGKLSPVHQPGHHQNKMECRLQSLNNLSEQELCKEMQVGTVESVSSHSIVFGGVLKVHGSRGVVEALPWPYILKAPDHCNYPTLTPGKAYFFDAPNIFTDPNHDSVLQSLHFILRKCGHC